MELRILEYPNPILRRATQPVTEFDAGLRTFIDEMTVVMKDDDGVGIAAPQVGVSKKIAVVLVDKTRYVLVNPKVVFEEGEQSGEEGCLSFPGIFGEVKRPQRVAVDCQDESGAQKHYEVEGFAARAFLHEIEHLNGKLLIDHFSPMKRELIRKRLMKKGYER
ncbi:MAG: peptide deformylase [Pyramidobacter sp.]